jgi:hypothetical protein
MNANKHESEQKGADLWKKAFAPAVRVRKQGWNFCAQEHPAWIGRAAVQKKVRTRERIHDGGNGIYAPQKVKAKSLKKPDFMGQKTAVYNT